MQVSDARIDEDHPITDPQQETTERQFQHAVVGQKATMRRPVGLVTSSAP